MAKVKQSGRLKFLRGLFQFLWEEIKTINVAKLRGLYKILTGYVAMKLARRRKRLTSAQSQNLRVSGY